MESSDGTSGGEGELSRDDEAKDHNHTHVTQRPVAAGAIARPYAMNSEGLHAEGCTEDGRRPIRSFRPDVG